MTDSEDLRAERDLFAKAVSQIVNAWKFKSISKVAEAICDACHLLEDCDLKCKPKDKS